MEIIEKLDAMESARPPSELDGPRDDVQAMASIGERIVRIRPVPLAGFTEDPSSEPRSQLPLRAVAAPTASTG